MTPDQLETLLTDRALGELAPEVAALLDLHLVLEPAAARRAAEIAATCQLTRAAASGPRETPRPLDLSRLRPAQRATAAPSRRLEVLRFAACLACGLALGWLAHPARQAGISSPAIDARTPARPTAPVTAFWSMEHFVPEGAKLLPQK